MAKKFLVLNINCQPLNPVQFGFKPAPDPEDAPIVHPIGVNVFLLEEEDARKFAEHCVSSQGLGGQKFHLVELKATAQAARPPVEWVD